jgi:endonuclease III
MGPEAKAKLAEAVLERLTPLYRDSRPLLAYGNPFELLIGAMLSAQCTDAMVNRISPRLFARFPDPGSLAHADIAELEDLVHSTGFFREKAKNVKAAAAALVDRFGGEVPSGMDDLLSLPGVGRKTANVIRAHIYSLSAVIVDTHFSRVTRRLGLAESGNPYAVEREILALLPEGMLTAFSMAVNRHGRAVCAARKPSCMECVLLDLCTFNVNEGKGAIPQSGDE